MLEMELQPPNFQKLFESTPAPLIVLSPEFSVVAASESYVKIANIPKDQFIGKDYFEVFSDRFSHNNDVRNILNKVLTNRSIEIVPASKYHVASGTGKQGADFISYWASVNSPILDSNGQFLQYA